MSDEKASKPSTGGCLKPLLLMLGLVAILFVAVVIVIGLSPGPARGPVGDRSSDTMEHRRESTDEKRDAYFSCMDECVEQNGETARGACMSTTCSSLRREAGMH